MPQLVTWVTLTGVDYDRYRALRLAHARGVGPLARSLSGYRYEVSDQDRVLLATLRERRDAALVDESSWLRMRIRCEPKDAAPEVADWLSGLGSHDREDFLLELCELSDEEWMSHARLLLAAASPSYAQGWLGDAPNPCYDGEDSLRAALGAPDAEAAEVLFLRPARVAELSGALAAFPIDGQPRGLGMVLARHYLATFLPGLPCEVSFVRWLRGHFRRLRDFYGFLASEAHGVRVRRFQRVGAASMSGS